MKKLFFFLAAVCVSASLAAQLSYNVLFTEDDYNDPNTVVENSGNNAWSDEAVRLGGTGAALNWDKKYIIIALATGTPDSISFTCQQSTIASSGSVGFRVREGQTMDALTDVINPKILGSTTAKDFSAKLSSTTKYVSLEWHGNFAGYYSNVIVYGSTPTTNLEASKKAENAKKVMINGQVYIQKGTELFDITGVKIN